jgi:hypothetical protein
MAGQHPGHGRSFEQFVEVLVEAASVLGDHHATTAL